MKIPYYVVRKGRGYWLVTPKMREYGFQNVRCGPDGPDAWAIAWEWYERWQAARKGTPPPQGEIDERNTSPEASEERALYPHGSPGFAFRRYRKSQPWRDKAERTREDWWRGWRHIKPVFADVDPHTVEPEDAADWYEAIKDAHGLNEAHRAMKIWRALWKIMVAFRYAPDSDPSMIVVNRKPKGRTETFAEGEVVRLVKRAIRENDLGVACIMAVAWDTQFAPVDCRTVSASQWYADRDGSFFVKFRQKMEGHESAIEAIGTISRRTERLIEHYLETAGFEPHPDAPLFRNQKGGAYSKDALSRAVKRIRAKELPGDKRQLRDFRRSGSNEAQAGKVEPTVLAAKMANSINRSKSLQDTYLPKRAAVVRLADDARRKGRQHLRREQPPNRKLKLSGPKS